jgi:mannonate dehydratase
MANLHLELAAPNFGIHEWSGFPEQVYELFPGLARTREGYLYPNDAPGLGIDFNEELAAKYPARSYIEEWTQARLPDGTPALP